MERIDFSTLVRPRYYIRNHGTITSAVVVMPQGYLVLLTGQGPN